MELLVDTIKKEVPTLNKNNIKLHVIGDINMLPAKCSVRNLNEAIQLKRLQIPALNLMMALSYSSRWELVNAVKNIAADVSAGNTCRPEKITQQTLQEYLSYQQFSRS
jgi:undecaprenyl diphosphate synthase